MQAPPSHELNTTCLPSWDSEVPFMSVRGSETNAEAGFRETVRIRTTTARRTNRHFLFAWSLVAHRSLESQQAPLKLLTEKPEDPHGPLRLCVDKLQPATLQDPLDPSQHRQGLMAKAIHVISDKALQTAELDQTDITCKTTTFQHPPPLSLDYLVPSSYICSTISSASGREYPRACISSISSFSALVQK